MSGPSLEELVEMGLPTTKGRPRLSRCAGCGEFFLPGERHCPVCGLDQILAELVERASPELLEALKDRL